MCNYIEYFNFNYYSVYQSDSSLLLKLGVQLLLLIFALLNFAYPPYHNASVNLTCRHQGFLIGTRNTLINIIQMVGVDPHIPRTTRTRVREYSDCPHIICDSNTFLPNRGYFLNAIFIRITRVNSLSFLR